MTLVEELKIKSEKAGGMKKIPLTTSCYNYSLFIVYILKLFCDALMHSTNKSVSVYRLIVNAVCI